MPTIRHVGQQFQCVNYAFSIDLEDAYLHIPIVKHHNISYAFFGKICYINGKFCLLGWPESLGFSQPSQISLVPLLKKDFCIVISLDGILTLVHSQRAGKRAHSFLCFLQVCLGLHINFSKSDLYFSQIFCFVLWLC